MLLAEDDADQREALAMVLEHRGYDVTAVGDGRAAIAAMAAVDAADFRFAVLDVKMPVMDGLEAAAQIRRSWPWMRIVFQTAMEEDWVRERFGDYDAYFRKPLDIDLFLRRLDTLLPERDEALQSRR